MILVIEKINDFHIWTIDTRLVYSRSDKLVHHEETNYEPAPELQIPPDEYLELLRPINGLDNSGYKWHEILDNHLNKLAMIKNSLTRNSTENLIIPDSSA